MKKILLMLGIIAFVILYDIIYIRSNITQPEQKEPNEISVTINATDSLSVLYELTGGGESAVHIIKFVKDQHPHTSNGVVYYVFDVTYHYND